MTGALVLYSATFARYALAVTPKNYLLFGCHVVNFSAQTTQAYRYVNHWYLGGKEKKLEEQAKEGIRSVRGTAEDAASAVKDKAQDLAGKAKAQAEKLSR